jgi:putative transport protein
MSFLTILLSPINLLFLIIIIGFVVGKLHIHNVSFGIAGVLFVAIAIGLLIKQPMIKATNEIINNLQSTMKIYSQLGSSLFVSVIGLQTGLSLKRNSKSSIMAFVIGVLMSLSGIIVVLFISLFDHMIGYTTLLGILCGSLTSTPGLSSVCELIENDTSAVIISYSCSYFGGVLITVTLTQALMRNRESTKISKSNNNPTSKIWPEMILISFTALIGITFGELTSRFLRISFGSTAFTLLFGLCIGYVVQKVRGSTLLSSMILNTFKSLGLSLFFVGTGFNAGIQVIQFDIKTVVYGALISLTAILFGIALCKLCFRSYPLDIGFVIAGGMTSSPAYGAIDTHAKEDSLNYFSFAYLGGLVALIFALQIII